MKKRFILAFTRSMMLILVLLLTISTTSNNVINYKSSQKTQKISHIEEVDKQNFVATSKPAEPMDKESAIRSGETVARLLGFETGALLEAAMQSDSSGKITGWQVSYEKCDFEFFADSGFLRAIRRHDFIFPDGNSYSEEEAGKIAEKYYKVLPVPQDYTLISLKLLENVRWEAIWSKEIMDGIFSEQEKVIINSAANNGEFFGCYAFNMPHQNREIRITKEEAIDIANSLGLDKYGYIFNEASLRVIRPNGCWMLEDLNYGSNKFWASGGIDIPEDAHIIILADHSRLAWDVGTGLFDRGDLRYFANVYIDATDGTILGGDRCE